MTDSENDNGDTFEENKNPSSRRALLATLGTLGIGSIAGCSGDNDSVSGDDGEIPEEWYENPPFFTQFAFPAALDFETEDPLKPTKIYPDSLKDTSEWGDPNLLLMVSEKAERTGDRREYWSALPFRIIFQTLLPPEEVGDVHFHVEPEIPPRFIDATAMGTGPVINPEEMMDTGGASVVYDTESSGRAPNGFGNGNDIIFELPYLASTTAHQDIPIKFHLTVDFQDLDYPPQTKTLLAAIKNHGNVGTKQMLTEANAAWKGGRKAANPTTKKVNVEKMYQYTKKWAALETGDLGGELKEDAVNKDIAAWNEVISDKEIEIGYGGPVKTGMAGARFFNVGHVPTSSDAPEVVDGQDFRLSGEFSGERYPTAIRLTHVSESSNDVPIEHLELKLEGTNADGVYPLSRLTDQRVSHPGDEFRFTEETFGADPLIDEMKFTFSLWYTGGAAQRRLLKTEVELE